MKKILTFIFLFCGSLIVDGAQKPLSGVINVGTNAEFAPFSFVQDGEIVGFEIDLAREVCKKLNCQMKIKDCPFEALIPELKRGAFHFIAAGMTITEERKKIVNFSLPYLQENPLLVVYLEGKVNPPTQQDLKKLKVVVNEGYTADFYTSDVLKIATLRLPTATDAILALKSGRADVFITATNTLKPLAEAEKKASFAFFPLEDTNDDCAFMISKSYPDITEAVNEALTQLKQEGVIDELKNKWGL